MSIRHRTRLISAERYKAASTYINNTVYASGPVTTLYFGAGETLVSYGHIVPRKRSKKKYKGRHPRSPYKSTGTHDSGGPVDIYKSWYEARSQNVTALPSNNPTGTYTAVKDSPMLYSTVNGYPSPPTGPPAELSTSVLTAIGVKAWAASKPTASQGALGQALGEIRDLPKIPDIKRVKDLLKQNPKGLFKNLGKQSGGEYLNYVFGWVPLVSDVKDYIKNIMKLREHIAQLERDNNRGVRRKKSISGGESVTVTKTTGSSPNTWFGNLRPSLSSSYFLTDWVLYTTVEKVWDYKFAARFRYHLDFAKARNDDVASLLQLTRILFGLDVSAYTLYQLMPWSWLIDWFVNVGDNLDNARDDEDHLVADYAYINGKCTITTRYSLTVSLRGDIKESRTFDFVKHETYFRRIPASPFGFGLTFNGFSLKQKAILGALGLTKLL